MNFGGEHSAHCLRYGQAPRGCRSGASGWPPAPFVSRIRPSIARVAGGCRDLVIFRFDQNAAAAEAEVEYSDIRFRASRVHLIRIELARAHHQAADRHRHRQPARQPKQMSSHESARSAYPRQRWRPNGACAQAKSQVAITHQQRLTSRFETGYALRAILCEGWPASRIAGGFLGAATRAPDQGLKKNREAIRGFLL